VWPKAQEFGFPNEEAAFALQFGHGIGLAIWEKPVISRLVSLEHSYEIKPGMVFALETFWPSKDGWSAARIEEEIVVTETGHEVITRFPAEKLLVAGAHYFTVDGPLPKPRASTIPRPASASSKWWKPARESNRWFLARWPSASSCPRSRWRRKPARSSRGSRRKATRSPKASRSPKSKPTKWCWKWKLRLRPADGVLAGVILAYVAPVDRPLARCYNLPEPKTRRLKPAPLKPFPRWRG
jgi:hypothetical protein